MAKETGTVAACLMPDHLHWLLRDSSKSLEIVRGFKSYSTHLAWKRGIEGKLWQRSFWDHVIRSNEKLSTIAGYIAQNPVRAGLVTDTRKYPYQLIRL